jgi:heme exporter protein A
MLQILEVACVRGERTLFNGLTCALEKGSLLRVTGPNGSGKTSLLRILCGLAAPAGGEVRWDGESVRRMREEYSRQLVYLGHANAVKDDLTARENLAIACALNGCHATADVLFGALREMGIERYAELPARFLSQGQRRRVGLARLVVASAVPLWILDEPFNALDQRAVARLQDMMGAHVVGGGIVIFTSHQEVAIPGVSCRAIELGV